MHLLKDDPATPPTAEERNELLAEIRARRPIFTAPETGEGGGAPQHNWRVSATRRPADPRQWRIDVSPGCVNQEPARITYLRQHDPRGWEMPADYAPLAELARVFSADYPFVDRSLLERPAPFLLISAPAAGGSDLGSFEKIEDAERPAAFRGKADWKRELYRATVWLSVTTWRADPAHDRLAAVKFVAQPRRWRVFAGQRPPVGAVKAGEAKELARLWLLRAPGRPETDQLRIEQRTFWSLGVLEVQPTFGFPLTVDDPFSDAILTLLTAALDTTLAGSGISLFWSA